MRFRFSLRVTVICLVLAGLMLRMSWWQSERHAGKISYIKTMEARLKQPVEPITSYSGNPATDWSDLAYRRLSITCHFDYQHEMILRNRRHEEKPGAFVITPCKIAGSDQSVLVNRGFVAYAFMTPDQRVRLNRPTEATFTGLVKQNMERKMFSPKDPPAGDGQPWRDAWLRIAVEEIQKQIPYPLLPVYLEIIPDDAPLVVEEQLVETKSGREEMFYLGGGSDQKVAEKETVLDPRYPIPVYDTVIPPGRHLGYIYEWAAMALMTVMIGAILQMKRPGKVP